MSPIEGISDLVRMPRLGKIRLGIKETSAKTGNPYPKATDYFVVPPEVAAVYDEKPKELEIMFPVEDPNQFAQQWLRSYSMTMGLTCIGNGETCRRKIDLATGGMADHNTKNWVWEDNLPCDPQECPKYLSKQCRRVLNLQFLLPDVPGLGVYQIDSSSFYSIVNINSMVKMLKGILGRCSMIPLTLALGPIEVTPPGQKKKTVYIMHIKKDIKLADLARLAQLPPAQVLMPEPEVTEPPEDLFPQEVLEGEKAPEPETPSELPFIDDALLEGWDIAKSKVKELKLTNDQISRWWLRYGIQLGLADFDRKVPPEGISNEKISRFVEMMDLYKAKAEEIAAEK